MSIKELIEELPKAPELGSSEMAREFDLAAALRRAEEMKALLSRIAYPRRGTADERMGIQEAAELIQAAFSMEDLEAADPREQLSQEDVRNGHARMWHSEARRLAKKHGEKTFYN